MQEIISCYDNSGISSNPKNQNKMDTERYKIVRKYFSEDEIKEAIQNSKDKYTFIEQVFSIKTTETHKILTLFGIHIKLKLKKSPFFDKVKVYEPYSISETTIGDCKKFNN